MDETGWQVIGPIALTYGSGIAVAAAWLIYRKVRRAFLVMRLKRLLALNRDLMADEVRDYQYEIALMENPTPETDGPERWARAFSELAAISFAIVVGLYLGIDWLVLLTCGAAGAAVLQWIWRRNNAQPPDPTVEREPEPAVEIPRDAIAGFAAAMCVLGLLVLVMWIAG